MNTSNMTDYKLLKLYVSPTCEFVQAGPDVVVCQSGGNADYGVDDYEWN